MKRHYAGNATPQPEDGSLVGKYVEKETIRW